MHTSPSHVHTVFHIHMCVIFVSVLSTFSYLYKVSGFKKHIIDSFISETDIVDLVFINKNIDR